jgi:hypothetical protein
MKLTIQSTVWKYHGAAAWHFVTIPTKISEKIKNHVLKKNAWGSIKVSVGIGKTSWNTSIFRNSKSASYLLPVKAAVRKKEGLKDGSRATITLTL